VPDHQGRKALTINKYDLKWMTLGEALRRLSEI
jgi:hypothetical protein